MVVVVLLLLLLVVPLLVVPLLKRRQRRRKRVCQLRKGDVTTHLLIQIAEKEESDEDMGFGLFD